VTPPSSNTSSPATPGFSTRVAGDQVALPSAAGTIFVRMHGAADGDTGTGHGAIVYNRPASAANFTLVQSFQSEFTLHQTGTVPAGGSTSFRFPFVQDFKAANVTSMAQAAAKTFLNTISVSKSGKGKGHGDELSGRDGLRQGLPARYADGTSVTLKAKAASGSKFSGWSGACKSAHSCKITANGSVTVKARFVLEPCVVPDVRRKTLKAAKLSLKKAFCSLGKVTTEPSSTVTKGLVVSQNPKHGKRVKQGTRVNLVVSTG
jgi:PASTA domain/Divergent InlB B-repeat domain